MQYMGLSTMRNVKTMYKRLGPHGPEGRIGESTTRTRKGSQGCQGCCIIREDPDLCEN